ncbi:MAG: hypothetical protein AAGD92_03165 [Pseudomonadota bacterium]
MNSDMAKLLLCVVLDILDFTIGRIPGFELPFDILLGVAAVVMWGWPGLFAFWEVADPTGQIDGFTPTLTLIALSQMGKRKKKDRNANAAQTDAVSD